MVEDVHDGNPTLPQPQVADDADGADGGRGYRSSRG
jgi:hypothetical protein